MAVERAELCNRWRRAAELTIDQPPVPDRSPGGYIFSRAQWLRREDKATEAAELMLSAPNDPTQALDVDQWWI